MRACDRPGAAAAAAGGVRSAKPNRPAAAAAARRRPAGGIAAPLFLLPRRLDPALDELPGAALALVDQGLAEEEDGEIRIARSYRQTEAGDERLRVGTVDAFQGKEFDVVFLSIVRANDVIVSAQKEGDERERLLNGKYGHLRLANRLNVAMSRQRKLLVAVGDQRMAEGPESEEGVPALTAFLKLCREEMAHGR